MFDFSHYFMSAALRLRFECYNEKLPNKTFYYEFFSIMLTYLFIIDSIYLNTYEKGKKYLLMKMNFNLI